MPTLRVEDIVVARVGLGRSLGYTLRVSTRSVEICIPTQSVGTINFPGINKVPRTGGIFRRSIEDSSEKQDCIDKPQLLG